MRAPLPIAVLLVPALVGAGLGAAAPALLAALSVLAVGALAPIARARLRRGCAPSPGEATLAVLLVLSIAGAGLLGSFGDRLAGEHREECRRAALDLSVASVLFLAFLVALPRLSALSGGGETALATPAGKGTALVLVAGLLFHAVAFVSLPPLVQLDSFGYLVQQQPFVPHGLAPHSPPFYPLFLEVVRRALLSPAFETWLGTVVLLQHALAVGVALAVEAGLRRAGASPLHAALGGFVIALDGQLALYAHSIMSEALALAFALASVLLLVEAGGRERPARLVALAGLAAALATITRQAAEGWVLVPSLVLLACGGVRPRARALMLFLACALLPVALVALHNHAFSGRLVLTGAAGRNLIMRATWEGMPELTDPGASPDDPLERARRIVREERPGTKNWGRAHERLGTELGWSDAEIDAAFVRFYFEQLRRDPGAFVRTTAELAFEILRARETWAGAIAFQRSFGDHAWVVRGEEVRPPRIDGEPPSLVRFLEGLALPTRLGVLALAALAPFVARGQARVLALLSAGTVLYFVGIAAVTEQPIPRYRLPAMPFVVVAAMLALAAVAPARLAKLKWPA